MSFALTSSSLLSQQLFYDGVTQSNLSHFTHPYADYRLPSTVGVLHGPAYHPDSFYADYEYTDGHLYAWL